MRALTGQRAEELRAGYEGEVDLGRTALAEHEIGSAEQRRAAAINPDRDP